jgi:acetyl esterase/lipase
VSWAYLGVGVVAFILSVTALWPPRGPVGSALSFVPSWIVGEAPLHLLAVVAAATVGLGLAGAFGSWPAWAGLALAGTACGGLSVQFASGLMSRRQFRAALAEAGQIESLWHWTLQDTGRVARLLPTRTRRVDRIRDISYAEDSAASHRLDIYRKAGPGTTTAAPVILYFHGGAWTIGDKREQGLPLLGHLAERGFVCVTANYALSPKGRWPQHVLDCKLALVWVKKHIAGYGGDPSLVFLSGASAGGHLAALVALTAGDEAWQPGFEEQDTTVAGCIPLYGVYDFVDPEKIGNPNLVPLLEKKVFEQAAIETYTTASPISRIAGSAPPFLVVHGRNDVLVPVATARAFVVALRRAGTQPVGFAELPLAQHAFDNFWSPRTVHLVNAVERFATGIVSRRAAEREVGR